MSSDGTFKKVTAGIYFVPTPEARHAAIIDRGGWYARHADMYCKLNAFIGPCIIEMVSDREIPTFNEVRLEEFRNTRAAEIKRLQAESDAIDRFLEEHGQYSCKIDMRD